MSSADENTTSLPNEDAQQNESGTPHSSALSFFSSYEQH
jgi:hypothetical protein